jgi:hypothetical protein
VKVPAPPLQVTRHVQPLSQEEADEVAGVVADLIVNFLKVERGAESAANREQEVRA